MKIIKITLKNLQEYIVISKSIDNACKELLNFFEKEDIYFPSERQIREIEIIGSKIDNDDYENIYEII